MRRAIILMEHLEHPNIVRCLGHWEDGDQIYMVGAPGRGARARPADGLAGCSQRGVDERLPAGAPMLAATLDMWCWWPACTAAVEVVQRWAACHGSASACLPALGCAMAVPSRVTWAWPGPGLVVAAGGGVCGQG